MLVHIESVKVIDVRIPFSRPRGSAVDPAFAKTACLVITRGGGHLGFAEAPVFAAPTYDEQFVAQTHAAIELFASAMLAKGRRDGSAVELAVEEVVASLARYRGNSAAKAAIEISLLDLYSRQRGIGAAGTLAEYARQLGHLGMAGRFAALDEEEPIPAQGTSLALLEDETERSLEAARLSRLGYRRLKVKVDAPFEPDALKRLVAAADIEMSADANGTLADRDQLAALLGVGFSYVEQPFAPGSLHDLAQLHNVGLRSGSARIALDESISGPGALRDAIALVPFSVAVLKVSRLGGIAGLLEAVRIAEAAKIGFYIGGMYDTPVLRRLNALLVKALEPPEISDLGPDSDFFGSQIPPSVVRRGDGELMLVGDEGISGPFVPAEEHAAGVSEMLV
ncbi:MAG: hypothetical protein M0Z47_05330 [Actinomycetota bacterium]|nr:hypothetical protein [Actinomycetota bacterium]